MITNTENGPTAASEVSLAMIEARTKRYADDREALGDVVRLLNEQVEGMKRAALPDIKRLVARSAESHGRLAELVELGPGLFVKPRTVIFHGIKVGYEKGKGKIEFEDQERVVQLVRRLFPEQADVLIVTKESVSKTALAQPPAGDLKRLGCTIGDTDDQVVIRAVDSAVDKVVEALLKEATAEGN